MADETKTNDTPEAPGGPPAPEQTEQAVIPGMDGGPAPSGKVIDLSDVRAEADKSGPEAPPEQGAAGSVTKYTKQEWERPLEEIEAEQKKPRRGRPPKADRAAPEAGEKKTGRGRTPKAKADKAPGKGKRAAPSKGAPPTPAKEEAPAPPPEPAQSRDATRAEREEIVYLNLSDLHPFKDHPFGVRDDAEMQGLVESVRSGGVNQPALVRPREDGGYEIIAGHRRQRASELAGFMNMPCIVRNMTDDEAKLIRYIKNIPIAPISYVRTRGPKYKNPLIQKYTPEGRARIHENLAFDTRMLHALLRQEVHSQSAAYADNRLSLFCAQYGKCAVVRSKYITFGAPADNLAAARPRLERVEADIMGNFKRLGVQSHVLNGWERLEALHGQLHPGGREPFRFSWGDIPKTGMGTKDFIVPDSFDFTQGRTFRVGQSWGAASFLQIMASELSDKLLLELLELDAEMTVTVHIQTVDQTKAIKTVKGKISDIDKMKVEEQRKATRSGYDPDILPPDLITYAKDAAALLADLQSRNERMFLLTFLVVNTAPTRERLENEVFTVSGIAQKHNCTLRWLDYQQEQGYMSSLPLGWNGIEIQRGMTTSSTAIFIPFMTKELRMDGQALYYGMNALSNNVIMADRKRLKNPNGMFLGTPGSGKSFAAKREIVNVFLTWPEDDIIIADPEGEYYPLVNRLGGQVVKLTPSASSGTYINPMDINPDYADDEDPLSLKSDFILSLCELIVGGRGGLAPVEKTVIDRAVRNVYRPYLADPAPERMPILQDLYEELLQQPEPEARRVASALELYCTGALNLFNHRTNVEVSNRLLCYDIKALGKMLKKIGLLILTDQVWGRVTANREKRRATWVYQDEFHVLLADPQTAAYSVEIFRRFRKWGAIPSGITQNVKSLLESSEIESIFGNCDFLYLLSQAAGDREVLASHLGISPHQLSYVTHSGSGEGLLFYGDTAIPFVDRFPKDTELYTLLTTKPEDKANERKDE